MLVLEVGQLIYMLVINYGNLYTCNCIHHSTCLLCQRQKTKPCSDTKYSQLFMKQKSVKQGCKEYVASFISSY